MDATTERTALNSAAPRKRTLKGVESLISLRYPNGRVHEASLTTTTELQPGHGFELYGRHWNAVQLLRLPRGRTREAQRMLCLSTAEPVVPER
jgi:hypothetical protein